MSRGTDRAKLRLIQAGVGGHGRGWAMDTVANSPDFEPVALADPNAAALATAGEALGVPEGRRFADLADAVRAVEADAVLSVTPPRVHAKHAEIAFGHGLHLLVEKPLAEDLPTARRMVDLADAAGRQLMVGQNRRWDAEPVALRRAMDDRPVGEFGHGHIDFHMPADFRGSFRQSMPHVLLVDMAVHHVDLIRFVLRRDVARVWAEDFNPAWASEEGLYEHGASLRMVMTLDDGTKMSYAGDWSARGRATSWQGAWHLQCARGAIAFDDHLGGVEVRTCDTWGKDLHIDRRPIHDAGPSQGQLLAAFARSVRTGEPGLTNGRDNLKTVAAVFAAVESCETGQVVELRNNE